MTKANASTCVECFSLVDAWIPSLVSASEKSVDDDNVQNRSTVLRRSLRMSANASKLRLSSRRASIDEGDDNDDADDTLVDDADADADAEAAGIDASQELAEEISLNEQVRNSSLFCRLYSLTK